MKLKNEVQDLVTQGVISQDVANSITEYYAKKPSNSTNRLLVAFGVLGSILVGLGIILIIAHNWDTLSQASKTFFAFLPLLLGQVLCIIAITKKWESMAWRESSSILLFFGLGASISLIGQVYHIPGEVESFILTWMILSLPIVYFMNSKTVYLLFLVGISVYSWVVTFDDHLKHHVRYLLLFGVSLAYYVWLISSDRKSGFLKVIHWFVPLTFLIASAPFFISNWGNWPVTLTSICCAFLVIGQLKSIAPETNSYNVIGNIGALIILYLLSYQWIWEDGSFNNHLSESYGLEFLLSTLYFLIATSLLVYYLRNKPSLINPLVFTFLVVFLAFRIPNVIIDQLLINLFLLGIGIYYIIQGVNSVAVSRLNFGLAIISLLIMLRFFDGEYSFVLRGVVFLLLGLLFFGANYWITQQNKTAS